MAHFGIAREVAQTYRDTFARGNFHIAVLRFADRTRHIAIGVLRQLFDGRFPINVSAGFNGGICHARDELLLVFLRSHAAGPCFNMVFGNCVRCVGGEKLDCQRLFFGIVQCVNVPVEGGANFVGVLAAKLRVRSVSAAQLPVVEKVKFVDLGYASRFQEF